MGADVPSQIAYGALHDWIRIGGGNFGNVYRAFLRTGEGDVVVAVKELLNPDAANAEDDMDIYYQREMATLKELQHPNVLKLLGLCKHGNNLFIITEFIEGGDLRRHLKNKALRMSWSLRTRIARDCGHGVHALASDSASGL